MRASRLAPVALAAALSACGGGGGSGAPVAPINPTVVANTGTLSISFTVSGTSTPSSGGASSVGRAPRYVSPGTKSVAVYDGTTLLGVANYTQAGGFTAVYLKGGDTTVTSGSCSGTPQVCTVNLQAALGAHTFDVIAYNAAQSSASTSTPPAFAGTILCEGELSAAIVAGPNPAQTIVPLGVATTAFFVGPVLTQRLNGTGPLVGVIGTTYMFQYAIDDASQPAPGFQIVQPPAAYDNGPVTIAETDGGGIVTMTAVSQTSPPASPGLQSFTATCAASGTATITASAKNKPNAAYASGLTYGASNYSSGTLGTTTLQCVPNSATLPVTVQ
jgi:hypothetical protein